MDDLGARLKRAREERGLPLSDIANRTKISVTALDALERNDLSRLPGGIFGRAFVRAYATELGLDPDENGRGLSCGPRGRRAPCRRAGRPSRRDHR